MKHYGKFYRFGPFGYQNWGWLKPASVELPDGTHYRSLWGGWWMRQ